MFVMDYNNAIISFAEIIEKVVYEKEQALVTSKDNKNVVVISLDEYNKLMKVNYENKSKKE